MHANSLLSRTTLLAGLLGTALLLSAGPLAAPAEAHRRHGVEKGYRHHPRTVVVRDRCEPRRVVVRRYVEPVRYALPWYVEAPRVYVDSNPFYFFAGLNVYLGGVNLNVAFSDPAPYGYVYLDPYCDVEFTTVADYHRHLRRHHHEPALRVVCMNNFDY
jgi:hypothetical protein